MRTKIGRAVALALLASGLTLAKAEAQDIDALDMMPPDIARRVSDDPVERSGSSFNDTEQGYIDRTRQWASGDPILVCFWEGNRDIRRRIVAVAKRWNDVGANIQLDFGNLNDPRICARRTPVEIRIGFGNPGYWSYIGRDSILLAPSAETSLNLFNFGNVAPTDPADFDRIVLHEFGHALGFIHEHQHPLAACDTEYNWPKLYAYFGGTPYFWPQDVVDRNMRSRRDYFAGPTNTPFDASSVMLYPFPSDFYTNGTASPCYSVKHWALSDGDRQTLLLAYPVQRTGPSALSAQQGLTLLARAQRSDLPDDVRVSLAERVAVSRMTNAQARALSAALDGRAFSDVDLSGVGVSAQTLPPGWLAALRERGVFELDKPNGRATVPSLEGLRNALSNEARSM